MGNSNASNWAKRWAGKPADRSGRPASSEPLYTAFSTGHGINRNTPKGKLDYPQGMTSWHKPKEH